MDEIGQRLKECADACMAAYEKWDGAKKDIAARESLQEAVHELRKVSARLEIEMAASEREEMSQRPIPVPPHRASRRRDNESGDLPDFITEGNTRGDDEQPRQGAARRSGGRRPPFRQQNNPQQGSAE